MFLKKNPGQRMLAVQASVWTANIPGINYLLPDPTRTSQHLLETAQIARGYLDSSTNILWHSAHYF